MAILTVGPTGQYQTISAAVAASNSGDTIRVTAGTYTNDFPPGINHNLTLEAVGGRVDMVATVAPPNGKGILDVGAAGVTVTVTGFTFSGAQVADANGAGIRYEAGNLILVNDSFHDNQNGLLSAPDLAGNIVITNCEFKHNGSGTGFTHNLYVGEVNSLIVNNSYFHDAVVGHEIKSRALNTTIVNSRVQDGPTGTASYSIDMPNGGNGLIVGSVIEKGPNAQNSPMITSGEEGGVYGSSSLIAVNDTFLNDRYNALAVQNATPATAIIEADKFYGLSASQISSGPSHVAGSQFLTTEPALNTGSPFASVPPHVRVLEAGGSVTTGAGTKNLVAMTNGSESMTSHGTDTVLGGSGSDTVHAGANHISVTTGLGGMTFIGGTGPAFIALEPTNAANNITLVGAGTVTVGGSATTLTGGAGADLYKFNNGYSSHDVINQFQNGTDHLRLLGFSSNEKQNAVNSATDHPAGIQLTLSDGTQITLTNIHNVNTSIFG